MITRRKFLVSLGTGVLSAPLVSLAQQPKKIPRIGYLMTVSAEFDKGRQAAFQQGLQELGYIEDRNVVIEWRHAPGRVEKLPELAAIRMALEMRDAVGALATDWKKSGYDLGFGVGVANGYATMGAIGFEGRRDYGAIGTVCNLAARLCAEAKAGQILVSQRVCGKIEQNVSAEPAGELTLKGFHRPMPAFNVLGTL